MIHIKFKKTIIILTIIVLAVIFLFFYNQQFNQFRLIVFDVGQGDSLLIRTQNGQNILIDGGPDATIQYKLGEYLPFYDRQIDLMVLTHPHADHVTGLAKVLELFEVKQILMTAVNHTAPSYLHFLEQIKQQHIKIISPTEQTIFVFDDLKLQIIYPEFDLAGQTVADLNDSSIVIMAETQNKKFLLTGDIGVAVEQDILQKYGDYLKSDFLKVAHQGSITSSDEKFLQTVKPAFAAISVGVNDYGHPSPRVIKRLERIAAQVLRTDLEGDLVFKIDNTGQLVFVK